MRAIGGDVLLLSSGHILRVQTARDPILFMVDFDNTLLTDLTNPEVTP